MKKLILILFIGYFVSSCSENEPSLSESFLKIYDDSNFDVSYHPIDVVETVDGYIILAGTELSNTDFTGVQLIKVDEEGSFEMEVELNYVVPIGEMYLSPSDSNVYFFAMNSTSLNAVLISVNTELTVENETTVGGINYPLSSFIITSGNFLLQSYDPLTQQTQISEIGLDASYVGGASYSIGPGDDVEQEIISHYLNSNNRPLPFFCGEISPGSYFFNGFYNYSFSMVFTDFGGTPTGVVQGQSSDAGIRAALSLGGSQFAISGYQFDDNYQLASAALTTSGISSSVDLYPGNMAELKPYTSTKIINYSSSSGDYTVFAAETRSNQIVLHFYNSSTGQIDGIHHIGYTNPFTFSSIKVGADNSLLVLGTTFVAGRFERVMLNKISSSEISGMIN